MHQAYQIVKILKNLSDQIESLAAYDDYLFLATRQGNLFMYRVDPERELNKLNGVELLRSKALTKKPITQLEVVPDVQILISLSDNVIIVHDLTHVSFQVLAILSRTKGATLFALDVKKQKTLTGDVQCMIRLCVVVKRKLQFYYWKNKNFLELTRDISLPDVPKVIAWCNESLFIGFKSEYSLYNLNGEKKDIFPTGKTQEPLVLCLENDQFALSRDKQIIFVDSEGNPTLKFAITWTETPLALASDPPYILAVLSNSVEVKTSERHVLIQNIGAKDPRLIVSCKHGRLFIASLNDVWCLCAVHLEIQIKQLLEEKQFELAMKLVNLTDNTDAEKQQHIQHIQNLYAFDLFCKKEFKTAMDIFLKLETDPSDIIGLFPELLPAGYRNKLEYPDKVPILQDESLKQGLFALVEYLLQVRHKLKGDYEGNLSSMTSIKEGSKTVRSKRQLLQIVDTTLLKCYLQTNDALVASLLRWKDNHCHVDESERALRKYNKYSELIILYRRKGHHRKALELLKKECKKINSPLNGLDEIIRYLQHLNEDDLPLIFEFANWILKEHPNEGLKIFTEDIPEVDSLPRFEIFDFLNNNHPDLTIPYLEHIIHVWKDNNSYFHDILIRKYCDNICELMQNNLLPEGQSDEQNYYNLEKLQNLRDKLTKFLIDSESYTFENFPMRLLRHKLYEEAAIVTSKLGRHEEVLIIYIHILQMPEKAEEYCLKNYNKSKLGDKYVFYYLLKMYLSDPENLDMRFLSSVQIEKLDVRSDRKKALELLLKYPDKMDPLKTLSLLPSSFFLFEVREFLNQVLLKTVSKQYSLQLIKSLSSAENTQTKSLLIQCQSYKLIITELDVCRVCQKRIGTSAFGRFPNGIIVHYSCKDKYNPS